MGVGQSGLNGSQSPVTARKEVSFTRLLITVDDGASAFHLPNVGALEGPLDPEHFTAVTFHGRHFMTHQEVLSCIKSIEDLVPGVDVSELETVYQSAVDKRLTPQIVRSTNGGRIAAIRGFVGLPPNERPVVLFPKRIDPSIIETMPQGRIGQIALSREHIARFSMDPDQRRPYVVDPADAVELVTRALKHAGSDGEREEIREYWNSIAPQLLDRWRSANGEVSDDFLRQIEALGEAIGLDVGPSPETGHSL